MIILIVQNCLPSWRCPYVGRQRSCGYQRPYVLLLKRVIWVGEGELDRATRRRRTTRSCLPQEISLYSSPQLWRNGLGMNRTVVFWSDPPCGASNGSEDRYIPVNLQVRTT